MNSLSHTEPMKARLFVLIPTESHNAIVICRRHSKKVGVFKWDMLTNKVKVSQWMKGRIYEDCSDVSPDGRHFIYSMNKKGEGYTVISRAPWIKAISFWRNVGGWGGGIFIDNKHYVLFDGRMAYKKFVDNSLIYLGSMNMYEKINISKDKYYHFIDGNQYTQRLIDRGWKISKTNKRIFYKEMNDKYILEKEIGKGVNIGKGRFWEFHRIVKGTDVMEKEDWEWSEYRYGNIYYAQKGCLYELSNVNSDPKLIYDFNDEEFIEKIAPY